MGHEPVVQHALPPFQFDRDRLGCVDFCDVESFATWDHFMVNHLCVSTGDDPHTPILDGRLIKRQPAAYPPENNNRPGASQSFRRCMVVYKTPDK